MFVNQMASFHCKILSDDPNISIFAVNKHVIENLEFISKNSSIVFKEQINIGKFGFIFNAETPQSNDVAVKMVSESDVGEYELAWNSFHNKFVISLLQTYLYREINTRLFVMERAECTLDMCIRNEDFTKRMDCMDIVSSWIDNVVSGIQYIHTKGYGHCSVKRKNILIMEDNRAVLCHFHSLAPVNSFVNCDEIDVMLRPPECFRNGIDRRPVAGNLDIYCLGILVIEAITGDYLGLKLPSRVSCWSADIYPVLLKMTRNLTKTSKEKYPNTEKRNLNSARNFICGCLELVPEERVKISKLWKHQYIGGVELFPEKGIWHYKANTNKLRKVVKNLQVNQSHNHPAIGYKNMSCEVKEKSNKEKWQMVTNEESYDKSNVSNIKFSHELNNTIKGRSLCKDERRNLKQKCAHIQGGHGECFDVESASSLLTRQINDELNGCSHYEEKDAGNMNDNINYEADKVKVYKENEKSQSKETMFMLSENTDLNNIKKNENVQFSKNHYVEGLVDKELRKTNLLPTEDEFESTNCEIVSDSCQNATLGQLMNHTFSGSLVYRISHPENFLNKLSARLTHNERKRDVIRNIEKDVFCERVVDKDSSKMEAETGIFSASLKGLPLKMLDILLTHLL